MHILFTKANWERSDLSVRDFVQLCAETGYDGTEIYLPARPESTAEIRELHEAAGLKIVSHIATEGVAPGEHLRSLEERYLRAVELNPLFVNCHTGKDHFSFTDSLRIFETGERLAAEHGVPLLHETHRGRALFSAPAALDYLRALPSLRLTADFSHWVCVHESDLSDQPEALAAAEACWARYEQHRNPDSAAAQRTWQHLGAPWFAAEAAGKAMPLESYDGDPPREASSSWGARNTVCLSRAADAATTWTNHPRAMAAMRAALLAWALA